MPENTPRQPAQPNPDPLTPPQGETRRLDVIDRRSGLDRREVAALKAALQGVAPTTDDDSDQPPPGRERRAASDAPLTGLERRRGPGRRRSDFLRSAEEGQLTREQFLFVMAIEEFKRANQRTFPAWTDVLEVIRLLGYRKTMPSQLRLNNAEDWHEPHNAPSNVRPQRWAERFLPKPDAKRPGEAA